MWVCNYFIKYVHFSPQSIKNKLCSMKLVLSADVNGFNNYILVWVLLRLGSPASVFPPHFFFFVLLKKNLFDITYTDTLWLNANSSAILWKTYVDE